MWCGVNIVIVVGYRLLVLVHVLHCCVMGLYIGNSGLVSCIFYSS